MNRNHFFVLGNAGGEPVLRNTIAGGLVATVNIATNFRHRNGEAEEWIESTEWHRITAFDRLAKVLHEHVIKGTRVAVEGYMRTRKFVDVHHRNRYAHELVATRIEVGEEAKDWLARERPPRTDAASPPDEALSDVRVI